MSPWLLAFQNCGCHSLVLHSNENSDISILGKNWSTWLWLQNIKQFALLEPVIMFRINICLRLDLNCIISVRIVIEAILATNTGEEKFQMVLWHFVCENELQWINRSSQQLFNKRFYAKWCNDQSNNKYFVAMRYKISTCYFQGRQIFDRLIDFFLPSIAIL